MTDGQTPTRPASDLHFAELERFGPIEGLQVLDIGCGRGQFVRRLSDAGAVAWGLEVDPDTVALALENADDPSRIVLGDGRTLPFPQGSFDFCVFIFSFHHVPTDSKECLLDEVARVLRPRGRLLVVEPEPFGPMTEVIKPVDDETTVRIAAQSHLRSSSGRLQLVQETQYTIGRTFGSADQLVASITEVDRRRAKVAEDPQVRTELHSRFDRLAIRSGDGSFLLEQPCRAFRFNLRTESHPGV